MSRGREKKMPNGHSLVFHKFQTGGSGGFTHVQHNGSSKQENSAGHPSPGKGKSAAETKWQVPRRKKSPKTSIIKCTGTLPSQQDSKRANIQGNTLGQVQLKVMRGDMRTWNHRKGKTYGFQSGLGTDSVDDDKRAKSGEHGPTGGQNSRIEKPLAELRIIERFYRREVVPENGSLRRSYHNTSVCYCGVVKFSATLFCNATGQGSFRNVLWLRLIARAFAICVRDGYIAVGRTI